MSLFSTALDELGGVLARVDENAVDEACAILAGARRSVSMAADARRCRSRDLRCASSISECMSPWSAT